MARAFIGQICAFVALCAVLLIPTVNADFGNSSSKCPTGFANFGDSITDTGNALYAFPYVLDPDNPPYGETFFGRPAKRFCNGRLVPDFFSLGFKKRLLDPYFSTTAYNYSDGINLAEAGAAANPNATAMNPYSLLFQFNQFKRFLNNSADTVGPPPQPGCRKFVSSLPFGNSYTKWLYTIEIGDNDLLNALQSNTPPATIINVVIPAAVASIRSTIQGLYALGTRKFLIFGLTARGCSTIILTLNPTLPKDNLGCAISVNQLAQEFNAQLLDTIQGLRVTLPGVDIAYFDYYSANIEILTNANTYGFNPALTRTACCGAPGPGTLNYNPVITCGRPGSNNCANPEQYVNWDGVHFTEAFYRQISKFALTGNFTDNGINYVTECNVTFSKFGPTFTYNGVYPLECDTLFT